MDSTLFHDNMHGNGVSIAFPLFGLTIDKVNLQIDKIPIDKLDYWDWRFLESTQIAEEFFVEYQRNTPNFCLFSFPDVTVQDDSVLSEIYNKSKNSVDNLVLALRLFKKGTVIDPYVSVSYLRQCQFNLRIPGWLRTYFISHPISEPYTLKASEIPAIEDTCKILRMYFDFFGDENTSKALQIFGKSHHPLLRATMKFSLLITVLEIIFDDLKGSFNGVDFFRRVNFCANLGSNLSNLKMSDEMKSLRNKIAHGDLEEVEDISNEVEKLSEITRKCLFRLLEFSIKYHLGKKEIDGILGNKSTKIVKIFNSMLVSAIDNNEFSNKILVEPVNSSDLDVIKPTK